ncbi:hypothetical protein D3C83_136500 [compost metagenome]
MLPSGSRCGMASAMFQRIEPSGSCTRYSVRIGDSVRTDSAVARMKAGRSSGTMRSIM